MSTFIHPTAEIEPGAVIGEGTKIWRFCHVMNGAVVGGDCVLGQGCFVGPGSSIARGCHVQNNVSVYLGVHLGEDVFVGPSAVFTNVPRPRATVRRAVSEYLETHVGRGATIGANATIVCGTNIGEGAFIGAGAVVTRDIAARALAVGVPARVRGWVCDCGETIAHTATCPKGRVKCEKCGIDYQPDGLGGLRPS